MIYYFTKPMARLMLLRAKWQVILLIPHPPNNTFAKLFCCSFHMLDPLEMPGRYGGACDILPLLPGFSNQV